MGSKEKVIKYYIESNNLEYNVLNHDKNVFVEYEGVLPKISWI